jgi:outer membrane protein assembly factor BamC
MHFKKSDFAITPLRAGVLLMAVGLGGCSILGDTTPGKDAIDYRSGAAKGPTLEVPPDLTPLARDGRYQPQGGTISASTLATGGGRPAAPSATAPTIAVQQSGDVHLERAGDDRWIITPQAAEQVWPRARQFWLDMGFVIARENAEAGTLETDWAENRAKLPNDFVRRTLGSVLTNVFDSGERDRFMMRVERSSNGTEVYITHHGVEERVIGREATGTVEWVARPSDAQLEREMLTRLMITLGAKDEVARSEVAATTSTAAPKARIVSGQAAATLQVDDGLERAWRRIGLALDRGGFTVEDRDRNQGLYFVRFVDTKEAAKDEPNFFTRWFRSDDQAAKALNRYRIQVKAEGTGTVVTVLNYQGQPDNSANAQKIVSLLVDELKL